MSNSVSTAPSPAGMAPRWLQSLLKPLTRYASWLHTGFPAGEVEVLPDVAPDGSTNVPGLYVVGDLSGAPLLKFALDTGVKAVRTIAEDPALSTLRRETPEALDLVIIGGGVAGMAAALEAQRLKLRFQVIEASQPFSTLINYPREKPIFTYPTELVPAGNLQLTAGVREALIEEAQRQTEGQQLPITIGRVEKVISAGRQLQVCMEKDQSILAHRVIVAIGRSGNFRKLGVPGESLDKVSNRLHDPKPFAHQAVLVVGGGDSAVEAAVALAKAGATVTLSYRGPDLRRPKPENVAAIQSLETETPTAGRVQILLNSNVEQIAEDAVAIVSGSGTKLTLPNQAVWVLIGREAPLTFFRRSGVRLNGELSMAQKVSLFGFLAFCTFVYNWKAGGQLKHLFEERGWFPFNVPQLLSGLGDSIAAQVRDAATLLGTLSITLTEPGFYYSVLYTVLIIVFGIRRIQRRKTPYVTAQTLSLMAFQIVPLFLLPYIILPYLGHNGFFDSGVMKTVADALFPLASYGHGREYWRAFGLVLAWPLFIWNVFTSQPMWAWLGICLVQTFGIIPLIVYFWGKGAYCGWVCSCGALAETLGDTHRQKMPHGPMWNRLNMVGQAILGSALLMLVFRVISWMQPDKWPGYRLGEIFNGMLSGWSLFGIQLNYYWLVDVTLGGIIGVGLYFWYSGRVWCRFACPLAALMHIYSRFGRFRILADKKKCISCNVCTFVCHQGIDVMRFAQQGQPMNDPECVRCSACVQSCPTGVLQFGQVDPKSNELLRVDALPASSVRMRETSAHKHTHGIEV